MTLKYSVITIHVVFNSYVSGSLGLGGLQGESRSLGFSAPICLCLIIKTYQKSSLHIGANVPIKPTYQLLVPTLSLGQFGVNLSCYCYKAGQMCLFQNKRWNYKSSFISEIPLLKYDKNGISSNMI